MGRHAKPIDQAVERRVAYTRLMSDGNWEFGYIKLVGMEKTYVKKGVRGTLETASAANNMSYGEVQTIDVKGRLCSGKY